MISTDYLRGFIDGEGSFIITFRNDERYLTGVHIEPHFNITQKDKSILEKIRKEIGIGQIYYHKRDDLWHFNILKLKDLLSFVEIIKDGLYVKKDKAQRFYKCILLMKEKRHLTKDGVSIIFNLWTIPKTDAKSG